MDLDNMIERNRKLVENWPEWKKAGLPKSYRNKERKIKLKMSDITLRDMFVKFLSENNTYLKFLVNVIEHGQPEYQIEDVMNDVENDPDVISGAFVFQYTEEGHKFWKGLNERWYDIHTNFKGEEV